MFELLGILVVICVIGMIVLAVGYALFTGAWRLIVGIIIVAILFFALRGCAMG